MADATLTPTEVEVDNLVIEAGEVVRRTIQITQVLTRGTSLTLAAAFAAAAAVADGSNTGGDTFSAVTASEKAEVGTYTIIALTATTYKIVTPSGITLNAIATAGSAYDDQIGFTITTAGATTVAGDFYTTEVTAEDGEYVKTVAGGDIDLILKDDIDTTGGAAIGSGYYTGVYNLGVVEAQTGITVTEAMQDSARVNGIMVGTR